MVELMLMQNAQMHQIIMHNMMLKAIPPTALSPPNPGQDVVVRSAVKPRGNAVHHHHYGPQAQLLPPIGYPMWPSMTSSLPEGQGGPHMPSVQHVTGPITLPPLNMLHNTCSLPQAAAESNIYLCRSTTGLTHISGLVGWCVCAQSELCDMYILFLIVSCCCCIMYSL
ncbi:unnamed protein product [Oncorhynchus mykiss]|uniref:DUF4587 domain-containing protein n=1 Tax=Oncorhynchus mykiss TaxID=8022 RepID=A0A060XN23_ONCMY|nr:unnamed protein product [Oncorhynchus mykiss]